MNDRELADKVVALGVGYKHRYSARGHMYNLDGDFFGPDSDEMYDADFVRDWRVAGALVKKCQAIFVEAVSGTESTVDMWGCRADAAYGRRTRKWYEDAFLPRAIIEACVEALGGVKNSDGASGN